MPHNDLTHTDLMLVLDRLDQRQQTFERDVAEVKAVLSQINTKLDEGLKSLAVHDNRISNNEKNINWVFRVGSAGIFVVIGALGTVAYAALGLR